MATSRQIAPIATVLGGDLDVPLLGGDRARHVNLDHAASTPALVEVWDAVERFLPWYASVHRGDGYKSLVSTAAYEDARNSVRRFIGASNDDVVVFTRNTTDAVNLLARSCPPGTIVVTTAAEHHANLLPWRRHTRVVELPVPASRAEVLSSFTEALRALPSAPTPILLAVTGASNVTGETWPIGELAGIAHDARARIFVDAAQLAPHRPIDMSELHIDWIALSGHKLYAPFGAGALVGTTEWLDAADPYLSGGGAVTHVDEVGVELEGLPARHEAGTPNVVGAVALAAACDALGAIGMDRVASHDRELTAALRDALCSVDAVRTYHMWADAPDVVALSSFNLEGLSPAKLAAVLSAEHGVAVRSGSFCAHRLLGRIVPDVSPLAPGCNPAVPGAVRASLGVDSAGSDIDRLSSALREVVRSGPRWRYVSTGDGSFAPRPDDRAWPLAHHADAPRAEVGDGAAPFLRGAPLVGS